MKSQPIIHVVDDDETVRMSLKWLLESMKLSVQTHASARDFLAAYNPVQPGCLVADVRMPDISGLQLQEILAKRKICIPVVMITGHGDISMAVQAMKAGAFDFIEKPFKDQELLERVQQCLALDSHQRREAAEREAVIQRLNSLTPRESEVLEGVIGGKANKEIAADLDISVKTVEVHRSRLMDKMAVTSVAQLTALCVAFGVHKGKP